MGIDRESEVAANLQIGPTTLGMVRLYIETNDIELPLDFEPEEAEEIAEELIAAAERARGMAVQGKAAPGKPAPSKSPPSSKSPPGNAPPRSHASGPAGSRTKGRR
jgi:hypothetical protein